MVIKNKVKNHCIEILKQSPRKDFTVEQLHLVTDYTVKRIKYNLNQVVKMSIGVSESHKTIGNYTYSSGYYYDENLK